MALTLLICSPALRAEAESDSDAPRQEESWGSYIERAQRDFSAEIVDTGRWLDGLFGSDVLDVEREGSVLRLGLSTELKREGLDVEPSVQVQLELPRTEKRFNFYLESTVDDTFSDRGDDSRGVAAAVNPDGSEDSDNDFIAGFGYVDQWADYLDFRADAGIIVQWPPNAYTRMRLRRSFFLADWELRLGETLFWRRNRGLGAETEMRWQHPMEENYFFRSDTSATYLDREGAFLYSHEFLITHRLAPREALLYRWAFFSRSDEGSPFTRVVYDLRWRRPIYSDWLLMELRPGFVFPQEEDFEAQPQVFLSVEALFGDRGQFDY